MGGRGSSGSGGGKGGSGGASGGQRGVQFEAEDNALVQRLVSEGMTEANARRYVENDIRAEQLQRQVDEDRSRRESLHSVGWRRTMQQRISDLYAENRELRFGIKPRYNRR